MRRLFTFLFCITLVQSSFANIWLVDNNVNSPQHFSNLQNVIDNHAIAGDTVMVTGSPTSYGDINITKPLTIIGEGYDDAFGNITIAGLISIRSSNVFLTGFNSNSQIRLETSPAPGNTLSNVTVERCCCSLGFIFFGGPFNNPFLMHNITVRNTISYGGPSIAYSSLQSFNFVTLDTLILENNIFYNPYFANWGENVTGVNTVIVRNNLFANGDNGQNLNTLFYFTITHTNMHDAFFYNNIFYDCNPTGSVNCTFMNNLTYGNSSGAPSLSPPFDPPFGTGSNDTLPGPVNNNIYSKDPLFVNYAPLQPFGYNLDFHLAPGSPCIGAGLNGTDIGIYGGPYSFNVGEGPRIPIVDFVNMSKTADPKASNFYLQFDTRTRKSKDQIDKSRFLSQAEYWIDSLPIPGTGNLINLNPVDTLHYFDLIPFSIDSNCHSVAIRVKDNFGLWGFMKYGINNPQAGFDYYIYGKDVIFANTSYNHQTSNWDFADGDTSNQFNVVHHYDSAGVYNVCLTESSICQPQSSTVCKSIAIKGINSISPVKGGNIGIVTMTITGALFNVNTTVQLRDNLTGKILTSINDSVLVSDGTKIQTAFDLKEATLGKYDIIINVPNDTTFIIVKGFEVETGKNPEPYVQLIGPTYIHANDWHSYSLIAGNKGNVDALAVPVWFAVPDFVNVQLNFKYSSPNNTSILWDTVPVFFITDTLFNKVGKYKVYGFTIPDIPANGIYSGLQFKIQTFTFQPFKIISWNSRPFVYSDSSQINRVLSPSSCKQDDEKSECVYCIFNTFSNSPLTGSCVISAMLAIHNLYCYGSLGKDPLSTFQTIVSLASSCLPLFAKGPFGAAYLTAQLIYTGYTGYKCYYKCNPPFYPGVPSGSNISALFPFDPNEKYGSTGVLNSAYLNSNSSLNYRIHFENVDTATAPAQKIFMIDTLDRTNLDLSSFQLTQVGFGDTIIPIPPGRTSFTADIDLRPKMPLIARVAAYLNDSTGVVTGSLISLDPITKLPTDSVLLGILPPNDSTGRGEGFISYSIQTKKGIATGTVINNKADIYFDNNAPVTTQTWTNIIDDLKPQSKVNPLSAVSTSDAIAIGWSGFDNGPAGVYAYNVYFNVNNGPWRLWKYNTSLVTDTFVGAIDSTYGFYSVAIDSALNIEDKPQIAEATTTITQVLPLTLLTFTAQKSGNNNLLFWTTTREINVDRFEIERSINGHDFTGIGSINGGSSSYTFTDNNPENAINYYRLKMIDKDGRFTYSPIIKISRDIIANNMQVYPVPAKNLLNIVIQSDKSIRLNILLTDMSGRIIKNIENNVLKGTNYFTINTETLPSGQYMLKTKSDLNFKSKKVTIIH